MANRYFKQFQYTLEQDSVSLFGSLLIGAAGAVTTTKGGGIASIAKQATAGQYLITLTDNFARFFNLTGVFVGTSASGVASVQILQAASTFQADFVANKTLLVQFYDFAGAAVNAASGSLFEFELKVRNSTVGPFD